MFKCIKLFVLVLIFVALVFFGHPFLLDRAGRLIYKKDALKPADVIVILAGEDNERVEYGAYLFREEWAKKTGSSWPEARLSGNTPGHL
jgi:hypothetical protein